MSNHAGLKLALGALVIGAGTYFTLNLIKPFRHVEVKMEGLVPAEQVFDAEAPAATPAEPEAAAPASPAPASEPPAAAAPEAAPAPAPAPAAEPAAPPAASEKPAPAAPESKPVTKAKPLAAAPAKSKAQAEAGDSREAWWQSPSSSGFNVVYAGSAAFRRALVVMGSAPFASADSANASIKVLSASGKPVVGRWELNNVNASMLVFPLADTGLYRVQIAATLSDRQNRTLGTALKGTIRVE